MKGKRTQAPAIIAIIDTIRELFGADIINGLIADVVQWQLPKQTQDGLLHLLRGDDISEMI